VKIAAMADAGLFRILEAWREPVRSPDALPEGAIARCVDLKVGVVSDDLREAGRRAILNFGHTVGHAIERASGHEIGHGAAVGFGMAVEALVARELCGLPGADLDRLLGLLGRLELLRPPSVQLEALLPALRHDKKRRNEQVRLSVPARLGAAFQGDDGYTVAVEPQLLRDAWEALT